MGKNPIKFVKQQKAVHRFFKQAPKRYGKWYVNHFEDSFQKHGFTDKGFDKWKERKKKRKGKKKKKRALLVKSGRLSRSLRLKTTDTEIRVSTAVPYAAIHNEGGTITTTANVGKHKRKGSTARAHTRQGRKIKRHKRRGGNVKAHKRKMNTKIPKRQFMGNSKVIERRIKKDTEKEIKEIFKN